MPLFGRRKNQGRRCPECRYYFLVEGKGYCSKDVPENVEVKFLSREGVRRQCVPCPPEMTCESWTAK